MAAGRPARDPSAAGCHLLTISLFVVLPAVLQCMPLPANATPCHAVPAFQARRGADQASGRPVKLDTVWHACIYIYMPAWSSSKQNFGFV